MGNAAPEPSGQALTRLRIAAGLSARQLAEKAGVSHSAIAQAERGRSVTRDVLDRLAVVLGPAVRDTLDVWPPVRTEPLAVARRAIGLGRRQAAARAGVSLSVWRRAELGLGVRPANAKKIADAFGLDVADVLPIGEDPPDQRAA